jgi:REP element-mobilizing transposase RayT
VQAPTATIDDIDLGGDWASALRTAPEGFQPDWAPATNPLAQPVAPDTEPDADLEPIPDEEALTALSNQLLQLERQSLIEQPPLLDLAPAPLPNVRRTPHGLFDLSYTFLFVPRLPHLTLTGDLKARLEQWLIALADTHDWDASLILIEEDYVEISLKCAPADSPERVIKTMLAETSDKILSEYPRLAATHAKRPGAFWANGYYVVTPGRRLLPEEISAFVQYQRHEQSGGRL